MYVGALELDVLLGDVHSLKQKRSVVRPVVAELRRRFEVAAAEAVRLAMADLARSVRGVSTEEARRCLTRSVYRHTQEPAGDTSGAVLLPPLMMWVSQLARLQRASLALCVFGGLTHREAAALLDVPPSTVADLLTAGLRELGRLAAGGTATCP